MGYLESIEESRPTSLDFFCVKLSISFFDFLYYVPQALTHNILNSEAGLREAKDPEILSEYFFVRSKVFFIRFEIFLSLKKNFPQNL